MKIFSLLILLISQLTFAKNNCEKDFKVLLNSISENRKLQEKVISYPLKYTYVDTQSEDMPLLVKHLSEESIKAAEFSVYPLKSTQKAHDLVQKILEQNESSAKVSVFKPETDYSLIYEFQIKSGCWSLVEYINESL
jgi:hypothetical protein